MYQITIDGALRGDVYRALTHYLIQHSDSFLFHLPNMGKMLINARNVSFMPEYPLGYAQEENQEQHHRYIKQMQPYLDIIREDIMESYIDTGYLDQISSNEMEVFHVSVSEKTSAFFGQTDDFSKWKYPQMPEDPCFLYNGTCIFQCIAHENLYFLNLYDPHILELLKTNGVAFFRSE